MSQPAVIEVKELIKRYDKKYAINNLSFSVELGSIIGLLGPNGSGKSTTINCILSLLSYEQGQIQIFGKPMTPTSYDIKQRIGVVPQDVAVFNELTVYQNVDYFCGLYIKDKKLRKQYVEESLEIVELQDFKKYVPKKLSGGLKRRLNIACGIAHKPELIFFDEPTVAVDPQSRNKILDSIKKLNENGSTIVYTSHYMEEIEQLCTDIIIIDAGQILARGTKDELKNMINANELITIELPNCPTPILSYIREMAGVASLEYDGQQLQINAVKESKITLKLLHYLETEKIIFGNFYISQPTLNDVFLAITGKKLRDE
jgi:ABC-type multidrug transport system, ATPase component